MEKKSNNKRGSRQFKDTITPSLVGDGKLPWGIKSQE